MQIELLGLLLYYMVQAYIYTLFIYIIMGFFPQMRMTRIYEFFRGACEPLLNVFSPFTYQGISFAPIFAFLTLRLIQELILMVF